MSGVIGDARRDRAAHAHREPPLRPTRHPRALLASSHGAWLAAVDRAVSRAGVEVVGRTRCPVTALGALADLGPELLVTGTAPFGTAMSGVELIRTARRLHPRLRAVVVSSEDDAEHIEAAFGVGANAYVLESAHPDDITSAVRQAFQPSIYLLGVQRSLEPPATAASARLTRRESEILRLLAEGYSNAQLARMLWVTEQTIKFHLSNVYRKLDVANRTEASRWAQRHGLLSARSPEPASAAA